MGSCPGTPWAKAPHTNLCMLCRLVCYCLNTDFVGSPNTINICLILSTIYIFIPGSGCVDRGPNPLLFPGAIDTVKTTLSLGVRIVVFNATFNNISVISWLSGGNRRTRRKPPTCRKSLTDFITYGISSTHRLSGNRTYNRGTDCICSCKSSCANTYTYTNCNNKDEHIWLTLQGFPNLGSFSSGICIFHRLWLYYLGLLLFMAPKISIILFPFF